MTKFYSQIGTMNQFRKWNKYEEYNIMRRSQRRKWINVQSDKN